MLSKNQHFVPQFLLRNWSEDRRSISLIRLKKEQTIKRASISGQCSRRKFYGRELDEVFCRIEEVAAPVIADINKGGSLCQLGDIRYNHLSIFVLTLHQRTAQARYQHQNMINEIFRAQLELNFPDKKDIIARVGITNQEPSLLPVASAVRSAVALSDMTLVCLNNPSKLPFVISDHPVIFYNAMAENHKILRKRDSGAVGYVSAGLQIFLPISPDKCLFFFDPFSYCIPEQKDFNVDITRSDVKQLNDLQSVNAKDCLYYLDGTLGNEELARACREHKRFEPLIGKIIKKNETVVKPNGTKEELMGFSSQDIRLRLKLSFLSISSRHDLRRWNTRIFPPRSIELLAALIKENR